MIWGRIPFLCHNRDIISAVCFTFLTTVKQWINGQSPCCYNLVCLLLFETAMSQGEATHCSVGVWRRAGEYPGIFSDILDRIHAVTCYVPSHPQWRLLVAVVSVTRVSKLIFHKKHFWVLKHRLKLHNAMRIYSFYR